LRQSKTPTLTPTEDVYTGYEAWKGWTEFFKHSSEAAGYFTGECSDCKIVDADVMEIGFGSGTFLAWAHEQRAKTAGVEINSNSLDAAKKIGLELLPEKFELVAEDYADRFDTIIAFDVFEHFTVKEIIARLQAVDIMLRVDGHLLLRFPNGQSPFGLAPQHGDPTHKSSLSCSVFDQFIQPLNLEVIRYGPAYRVTGGGFVRGLIRRARYLMRDFISFVLNAIYTQNIPWDPVVVLVLQKKVRSNA
jgi:SAM-dependent methyltransferase